MVKYFLICVASLCFAASLALADDTMHGAVDSAKHPTRELAIDSTVSEQKIEVERSDALNLIQAFKEVERGLGKRSTGEVSEVNPE